jgi:hypothetical protein
MTMAETCEFLQDDVPRDTNQGSIEDDRASRRGRRKRGGTQDSHHRRSTSSVSDVLSVGSLQVPSGWFHSQGCL